MSPSTVFLLILLLNSFNSYYSLILNSKQEKIFKEKSFGGLYCIIKAFSDFRLVAQIREEIKKMKTSTHTPFKGNLSTSF